MPEQPVNPAQLQPIPDPVQPEPEKVNVVEDNQRDVPTVSTVDFDNLPKESGTNTPILEPVKDESAAQPQQVSTDESQAAAPQQVDQPVQTDNSVRPEDGDQDVSQEV